MVQETAAKTILIVEDNVGLNILLTEKVIEWGYETKSVHTGMEALSWLNAHTPYLIILDYSLPDMNGHELLANWQLTNKPIPPFIVSTGQGDESIAVEMMKLGAMDYLVKNMYFLDKLPEVIKRIDKEIENENKRKWTEKALHESEKRFRLLFENAPLSYQSLDINGKYIDVNPTWIKTMGYEYQEVIGRHFTEFMTPKSAELVKSRFANFIEKGEIHNYEFELVRKDKSIITVSYEGNIGYDELGNFKQTHCIFTDITESKKAENALKESEANLAEAQRISKTGSWVWDLVAYKVSWSKEMFRIFDFNPDTFNNDPDAILKIIHPDDLIAFQENMNKNLKSVYSQTLEYRIIHKDGSIHYISAKGKTEFDLLGNPIKNVGTARDITEQKLAQIELTHSEQKYREMADFLPVGLFETDLNGNITFINQTALNWLGYAADYFKNDTNIINFVADENRDTAINRSQMVMKEKIASSGEYTLKRKSGKTIQVIVSSVPLIKNDQVHGLRGTIVDITERKQAEEALIKSEKFNKEMIANISDVIAIIGADGIIKYKSSNIQKWFGWLPNDLIGTDALKTVHPDDLERIQKEFHKLLEKERASTTVEYKYKCKNGNYKIIELTAVNLLHDPFINGILANYKDITKRKLAEFEIINTKNSLKKAQAIAHIGNWELDLATKKIWASNEAFNIYGIENINQYLPHELIQQKPLPEYRPLLNEALEMLLTQNQPYDLEFQILHGFTNELRSIHSIAEVVKDEKGKPVKVIGVIQDITLQKQLENKLRILSNAIEQNPASIVITNIKGDIEYVNPKFTQLTGYTMQEAMGKNPRILKSDISSPLMYEELWNTIKSGNIWSGEFCNVKKTGELYWESAVIAPVFNSFRKMTHFVAVKENITDKKDTDKKILNAIIEGEERERERFSRELHDGLGPLLSSIKLYFQWIAKTEDPDKKQFLTGKGNHNINEAILSLREISNNLSPQSLNTFGLVLAIQNYVEGLNQLKNIHINLKSNIEKRFNATIEIALYRIILELINNCLKHAEAKEISLDLHHNEFAQLISLTYKDNGKGFDTETQPVKTKGRGLLNIQYRVNSLNGKINIKSSPGKGLEVAIEIPILIEK